VMNSRRLSRLLVGTRLHPSFGSAVRGKNDAEQHPFVQAFLPGNKKTPMRWLDAMT
jgi:hypothetical protein